MTEFMDQKAKQMVRNYTRAKFNAPPKFRVFIVWKCKTIQNWKYLIATSLADGMYYEVTYNGDRHEWYLDVYKKIDKQIIKEN